MRPALAVGPIVVKEVFGPTASAGRMGLEAYNAMSMATQSRLSLLKLVHQRWPHQIKDMALKFSGAYKQCKPCTGPTTYKKGQRPYPDFDTASEGIPYPYIASSSSTPAWDFPSAGRHTSMRTDSRFTGVFSGDRTPGGAESFSAQSCDVVLEDEAEPKEWMAQVEPGVHITFVSLPNGGNDLKRIRFSLSSLNSLCYANTRINDWLTRMEIEFWITASISDKESGPGFREMFNKWQAQQWWGENYDRIMELYNVQRFNRQALHTPPRSEDERDSSYSKMGSARESPMASSMPRNYYKPSGNRGYFPPEPSDQGGQHYNASSSAYGPSGPKGETSSIDASRTTTSSRDEASVSISNASDLESEWVEQDEPGVYITIRQLADGTRELRRVKFSREMFGEVHAKLWWEENRERIQAQYL
ncbi:Transcription factor BREVIS RADIX, N-terminal domain [Dillenia turbinata]|uniref:Transcription factor BREVIS RADIX, N-terminal domain n=1 Tax=Dillenia turbinata TaxID=194707 RepID=A0AAN8WG31_9MAGN